MQETQKVLVEEDLIISMKCDRCGEIARKRHETREHNCSSLDHRFKEFNFEFGYDSAREGLHFNFDLCDACQVEFVENFVGMR